MKTALILDGHASEDSLVSSAAKKMVMAAKKNGYTAEYKRLFDLPRVGHVMKDGYAPEYSDMADAITKADMIICATPVWWYGVTSCMKDFLDGSLQAGKHFKYEYNKWLKIGVPKGLLDKNKKLITVTTTGGPALFYNFGILPNMAKRMIQKSFKLCGLCAGNMKHYHFGNAGKNADERAKVWLEQLANTSF